MLRPIIALVAALGLVGSTLVPAFAQAIPGGSYQQSCSNIRIAGNQLVARCNAANGGSVRSHIALGSCRGGDIGNDNGQLRCNRGNGRYNNGPGQYNNGAYRDGRYQNGRMGAMRGSYQQSCTNVRTNGTQITATCSSANGQRFTTTLDGRRCNGGDIANVNGRLACR